ncbi:MAG: penicillin-binding protein 1B [Methyloprofundus sp.]|nr:penicillin-binding protein 1B [Methyloprofundus sp.]
MAAAKKTRKKRQTSKKKSSVAKLNAHLKRYFFIAAAAGLFAFFSYVGYLDYTVRHQFEGKRWTIPAHVYANPVELYAGLPLKSKQLVFLLKKLRYHSDRSLSSQASYTANKNQITLKTRGFTFWDAATESQYIRVKFQNNEVQRIVDMKTGRELAIVRLEPEQIGSFYPAHKEDRILVKLEEVPKSLINALIATEDRDFYQHWGVSLKGIARAMWVNIKAGGFVQGGSTLTQQLIKNFFLTPERSLRRKINEALMAFILEYHFSKEEILEAYLNEVYLAQDGAYAVHGFGLASEFYFSKPVAKLRLHEVAALVALVRGPSYYDLRRHPKRALKRRNLVLSSLFKQGKITAEQQASAEKHALKIVPFAHRAANRYPAFIELVKRQLKREYNETDLNSNGLRIFTTLDSHVQNKLSRSVHQQLTKIEKKPRANKLEAAAVVTRRGTGEVVALIGGRDSQKAGFNRALNAVRPIGSLIKPLIYLTALEYPKKYTLITPLSDTKIELKVEKGQLWKPQNYSRKEHGEVPLHTALAHSYNLATVRLGMDVGLGRIAKTIRSTGVTRPINLYPSLLLGALSLTPFEVTQMYQTLAAEGFSMPLRSITAVLNNEGELLQRYPYRLKQELNPVASYLTNTVLQEVMRSGTGRSAANKIPATMQAAGKTGTSNDLKDSWFAGFTGDYLGVFWVGRDDAKPAGVTGASGALKLWTELMAEVASEPVLLSRPDSVKNTWIDNESGLLATELCPTAKLYPFVIGSEPKERTLCVESSLKKVRHWFDGIIKEHF